MQKKNIEIRIILLKKFVFNSIIYCIEKKNVFLNLTTFKMRCFRMAIHLLLQSRSIMYDLNLQRL